MSRYLILVILNVPIILAGIVSALVNYKLGKSGLKKFVFHVIFWLIIFVGIATSKYIYEYLFSNNLTKSEPLSLFDVLEITGIIVLILASYRSRIKVDSLERRVRDLHQELSIRLSVKNDV